MSPDGVSTDPFKIANVSNWPSPTNVKELRSFLGLARYYRRFVKDFGLLTNPLTDLLKKGVIFTWTSVIESAFQLLKKALIFAPILAPPDFNKPFVVETDASDHGIGAVLHQDGHPIAYVRPWDPEHKAYLLMKKKA